MPGVAKEIIDELKHHQEASTYSEFKPERLDVFVELVSELSGKISPAIPFESTKQCITTVIAHHYFHVPGMVNHSDDSSAMDG